MGIRKNLIKNAVVIVNKKRGERPNELTMEKKEVYECPFCPGNEHRTPVIIYDSKAPYNIRISKNKYPIVKEKNQDNEGIFGEHYVVIEGEEHDVNMHEFTKEKMKEIIKAYKHVVHKLYVDKDIKYVQIFKNCGKDAGASIKHPHSQVVGINLVPKDIADEIQRAEDFYKTNKTCIYCNILKSELKNRKRIVYEGKYFTAFCPNESLYQYKMTIIKNHHQSNFEFDDDEMMDLGNVILVSLKKLNNVKKNCSYNLCFHFIKDDNVFYHFYIDIIPRLNPLGGFELGTGIMINTVEPEVAAETLRNEG
ncbi:MULTISPECIES: galactose-1-phosphate uridylyltransferase [Clostridium]|uniref:galactose-1-phosphate uridylyltransferase n=1 Tax=Clostridium TaxID=1485 RepID=UPI000826042E|nr:MULTISPECIES: DUF4931 domain-containing protein [Clostridium]PJI09205.1 DUF4931 domain-containing protein [Clostridium sp. CT7]